MSYIDPPEFYAPWPLFGKKISLQWGNIRKDTETLKVLSRSLNFDEHITKYIDSAVAGYEYGEDGFHNRFRTFYDKNTNDWLVQFNSATEASPVWVNYITVNSAGVVTFQGSFYMATLDVSAGGDSGTIPPTVQNVRHLIFHASDFYITKNSISQPVVNMRRGAGLGDITNAANLASEGIFASKATDILQFKGLVAGTGINLTATGTTITIDSTVTGGGFYGIDVVQSDGAQGYNGINVLSFEASNFYIKRNPTDPDKVQINLRPSTGTITGGTALGGTTDTFAGAVGGNLTFRGVSGGTGISVSQNATTITVTNTGPTLADIGPGFYGITAIQSDGNHGYKNINVLSFEASNFYLTRNTTDPDKVQINLRPAAGAAGGGTVTGGASLGGDQAIYDSTTGPTMNFKGLTAGTGISLGSDANSITVTNTGPTLSQIGPGFYGIIIRESDETPPPFRNDTIIFDSQMFYISSSKTSRKPTISIRLSGVNTPNSIPLSALNEELQDLVAGLQTGMTLYYTNLAVASNGTTVTATAASTTGHPIEFVFVDAVGQFHSVVSGDASISGTLTAGSDASPQANYLYTLRDTPTVMTVSTVDFPDPTAVCHHRWGTVICQSAASVQSYGPYNVFGYSDSLSFPGTSTGHIAHINEWIREQPATWHTGVALTPTINAAPAPDTVTIGTTSGSVFRVHEHTFPAFADPAPIYVVNHPTAAYTRVTTMPGLTSGGTAIANGDRICVVIWGNQSNATGDCKLFMNLPSAYYSSDAAAIADSVKYTNYTIPTAYKGSGFLIAKCTFSYATGGGGQYTLVENIDLRGLFPSLAAGGTTAAATVFQDNTFAIEDNIDATKHIAFQASGITTGTTRTLTVQDADGTIAYVNQIGPGFYGIGVIQSDNTRGYSRINTLSFEAANFYLTRSATDTDKVQINLRPSAGGGTGTITGGTALGGTEPVFAGTVVPNLTFKGLTAGTGINLSSDANAITITSTATGGGGGFYGITVGQSNDAAIFKDINVVKFNNSEFYVKRAVGLNRDEVVVSLRQPILNSGATQDFSSSAEWQFNHSLNTRNVVWNVYDTAGQSFIPQKVDTSNPNIAYFYMTPASAGKAVVLALGAAATGGGGTITSGASLGGTEAIYGGTTPPTINFKGLTAGTGINLSSDANAITITSTATGGGGGFYGITVGQSNDAAIFKDINVVKFNNSEFYVKRSVGLNRDEVVVSLRQSTRTQTLSFQFDYPVTQSYFLDSYSFEAYSVEQVNVVTTSGQASVGFYIRYPALAGDSTSTGISIQGLDPLDITRATAGRAAVTAVATGNKAVPLGAELIMSVFYLNQNPRGIRGSVGIKMGAGA